MNVSGKCEMTRKHGRKWSLFMATSLNISSHRVWRVTWAYFGQLFTRHLPPSCSMRIVIMPLNVLSRWDCTLMWYDDLRSFRYGGWLIPNWYFTYARMTWRRSLLVLHVGVDFTWQPRRKMRRVIIDPSIWVSTEPLPNALWIGFVKNQGFFGWKP